MFGGVDGFVYVILFVWSFVWLMGLVGLYFVFVFVIGWGGIGFDIWG